MSPTTAALCASLPFLPSSSIIFFALSQAPPELDWKIAIKTPEEVTPARSPPSISAPPPKPIITGTNIAIKPGMIISLSAAFVEISTHLLYSATPSASSKIFKSLLLAFDKSESYFFITSSAALSFGSSLN